MAERHSGVWGVACFLCVATMSTLAQAQAERVNNVIGEQVKAEEAARAAEKRIAQLDSETSGMLATFTRSRLPNLAVIRPR